MRDKLERELERLASAVGRDQVIDHGVNTAMTAWHLTEWVWDDLQHTPNLRARLASEAGRQSTRFGLEQFKRYVLSSCQDLAYCRIVTNNAKHLESKRYGDDPEFDSGVAPAQIRWVNIGGEELTFTNDRGEPLKWTSAAWDLWIVDHNGSRRRAAEIYQRVLAWWTSFIYNNQIDELQARLEEP